jgi:hypothetical protein
MTILNGHTGVWIGLCEESSRMPNEYQAHCAPTDTSAMIPGKKKSTYRTTSTVA